MFLFATADWGEAKIMIFFKPEVAATNELALFFQCSGSPCQIKTALIAVGPNTNNGQGH